MKTSTPGVLLGQMNTPALARHASAAGWARAAGLPKETLSRLKRQDSCDFATLRALAQAADCTLVAVPAAAATPSRCFGRDYESALLDLAASGNVDPDCWRAHGDGFLMGGLATLLAGARGFERGRYLRLAESLHAGVTTPEVFALWLARSPVRPGRFLPMARRRRKLE